MKPVAKSSFQFGNTSNETIKLAPFPWASSIGYCAECGLCKGCMATRLVLPLPIAQPTELTGNWALSQIRDGYADMLLQRTSIADNDLHQANPNIEAHVLDASRQIERDNYGADGSDTGKPCADCHPDLNFLIEGHGAEGSLLSPDLSAVQLLAELNGV